MMSTAYRLVGYDKNTERLAVGFDVPRHSVAMAKCIAGITLDDEDLGDWELDPGQAQAIGQLISAIIDTKFCDFFLEPNAALGEDAGAVGQSATSV
jgi:hypothetical protein